MVLQLGKKADLAGPQNANAVMKIYEQMEAIFFNTSQQIRQQFGANVGQYLSSADKMIFNQLMYNDNLDVRESPRDSGRRQIVFEKNPERRRQFDIAQLTEMQRMQELVQEEHTVSKTGLSPRRVSLVVPHTTIFPSLSPEAGESPRTRPETVASSHLTHPTPGATTLLFLYHCTVICYCSWLRYQCKREWIYFSV